MTRSRRDFLVGASVFVASGSIGDASALEFDATTDPDCVALSIDPDEKIIFIRNTKVSAQTVFIYLKNLWKTHPHWIKYEFPMMAHTPVLFEMLHGWRIANPECLDFNIAKMQRGLLANDLTEDLQAGIL